MLQRAYGQGKRAPEWMIENIYTMWIKSNFRPSATSFKKGEHLQQSQTARTLVMVRWEGTKNLVSVTVDNDENPWQKNDIAAN